jgi:hypothetical protein
MCIVQNLGQLATLTAWSLFGQASAITYIAIDISPSGLKVERGHLGSRFCNLVFNYLHRNIAAHNISTVDRANHSLASLYFKNFLSEMAFTQRWAMFRWIRVALICTLYWSWISDQDPRKHHKILELASIQMILSV